MMTNSVNPFLNHPRRTSSSTRAHIPNRCGCRRRWQITPIRAKRAALLDSDIPTFGNSNNIPQSALRVPHSKGSAFRLPHSNGSVFRTQRLQLLLCQAPATLQINGRKPSGEIISPNLVFSANPSRKGPKTLHPYPPLLNRSPAPLESHR